MAIIKIPLDEIDKADIVVETTTDDELIKKYNPDYLINMALYDVESGVNIVHMEDENKRSGYLFSDDGIGITNNNEIVWCSKDKAFNSNDIKDYCSFSPVLVKNGKVDIGWGNKYSSYVDGTHYRSFVGLDDNHLYLGVSDNKNSIKSLANYCVNQGMKYAGNNDGNGSVSLWENGNPIKNSTRRNASWLLVWLKKEKDDEMITKEFISVDGVDKEFNTIVKDGVTYLEMRKLAETVDCEVYYDSVTKKKSITRKIK